MSCYFVEGEPPLVDVEFAPRGCGFRSSARRNPIIVRGHYGREHLPLVCSLSDPLATTPRQPLLRAVRRARRVCVGFCRRLARFAADDNLSTHQEKEALMPLVFWIRALKAVTRYIFLKVVSLA